MLSQFRRLPGVRSLSDFQAGGCWAALVVLAITLVFFVTMPQRLLREPSSAFLAGLAGFGGAVFLAYTVSVSSLFRDLRRGSETRFFIGFLVGLGCSGVAGVGMALSLLEAPKPFGWPAHLALFWACSSLFLLGSVVASLPLFSYERARASYLNRDDE